MSPSLSWLVTNVCQKKDRQFNLMKSQSYMEELPYEPHLLRKEGICTGSRQDHNESKPGKSQGFLAVAVLLGRRPHCDLSVNRWSQKTQAELES